MRARVLVTLPPGALDPAGQAVADGLRQLRFEEVECVRGKPRCEGLLARRGLHHRVELVGRRPGLLLVETDHFRQVLEIGPTETAPTPGGEGRLRGRQEGLIDIGLDVVRGPWEDGLQDCTRVERRGSRKVDLTMLTPGEPSLFGPLSWNSDAS